jgi:hypothetical protein
MPASRGVVPHVAASPQTTARATGIPMQPGFTQRWFEQCSRWVAHRAVIVPERYRVARIEEALARRFSGQHRASGLGAVRLSVGMFECGRVGDDDLVGVCVFGGCCSRRPRNAGAAKVTPGERLLVASSRIFGGLLLHASSSIRSRIFHGHSLTSRGYSAAAALHSTTSRAGAGPSTFSTKSAPWSRSEARSSTLAEKPWRSARAWLSLPIRPSSAWRITIRRCCFIRWAAGLNKGPYSLLGRYSLPSE